MRELYFDLGLKFAEVGRAGEALAALEGAHKEEGDKPQEADLLLALAGAAQNTGHSDQAVGYLLQASLVDEPPRRDEIVSHVLGALNASAALSTGRWLIGQWSPQYCSRAVSPGEVIRAQTLVARTHLFLAEFEEAIELLGTAAASDAQMTRGEVARMLAPEKLPPSLSTAGVDAALVVARIWRAVGDPAQALVAADRALAAVTDPNFMYAPIYLLRGELFEQLGRLDEAARSLHQAARSYVWHDEAAEAVRCLERSLVLDPKSVEASWSLADALWLASYGPKLMAAERTELLRRARVAWDGSYAIRRPDKSDAWVYATGANITARAAQIGVTPEFRPALWQAAALIERALLLTPDDPMRWGNLSAFHRDLMNPQTALAAAVHGHKLDPKAPDPLNELVIILSNLGRWEEATEAHAKLEALSKTPWTAFVAARLHLYCGRPSEALTRIDEALESESERLDYLQTRGTALRSLQRPEEARAIAQAIVRDRFDLDDRDNLNYYGWAALECGELSRALQAYEADLSNTTDPFGRENARCYLALARLANNDLDGARELFAAGTKRVIYPESRWLLLGDMRDLERIAELWGGREHIAPVLAEFRGRVEVLTLPAVPSSSRDELEAALAEDGGSSWPSIGALAGLARQDRERLDFESAAQRYSELERRWSEQFPEAALGIDAALEGLREMTGIANYWAMRDRTTQPLPWEQRFFATYLGSHFKLSADVATSAALRPLVTPIAIELDVSLLPAGDDQQWPIIKTYLPEMRARIERDTGVKVPGTRLRSNEAGELSPNRLLIMLSEVPLLMPRVVHGAVYCLAASARVESLGATALESETDPIERSSACWIEPKHVAQLRAAGIEVLEDHHQYIVRQLEAIVRKNLAEFVGVDEVETLLESWRKKFDCTERIDRLRGDDKQLLRFTRLLRRLARERVPIVDGQAILDAAAECGMADALAALRAVRYRLRDLVVAAAPPARRLRLATKTEQLCLDWLHEGNGKTFLALPPADVQAILGAIRNLINDVRPPAALVVESARLRPHLRDLLELEFPDVAVFAAEELAGLEAAEMASR